MTRLSNDAPNSSGVTSTQSDDDSIADDVKEAAGWPKRQAKRLAAVARAFRDRMYANPVTKMVYRTVVLGVGLVVTIGGLFLVPLPGPGWVIVFVGLSILATESKIARRILDFARARLDEWTDWLGRQNLFVKGLVGLATAVFVACVFWGVCAYYGVPGFIPDSWVPPLPGLD